MLPELDATKTGEKAKKPVVYTADKVADWFLNKGEKQISPKKLQKLVYYAYAWTLTLFNDSPDDLKIKLFHDPIEAWVHGPAIHSLSAKYSNYGFMPIDEVPDKPVFAKDVENVLKQVWDVYGQYDADELESMTHQEDPWINARKGLSPLESGSNQINDKDIYSFYIKQAA